MRCQQEDEEGRAPNQPASLPQSIKIPLTAFSDLLHQTVLVRFEEEAPENPPLLKLTQRQGKT